MITSTPTQHHWQEAALAERMMYPGGDLSSLIAVARDKTTSQPVALAWFDCHNLRDPSVTIGVIDERGRVTATTDSTQDWPRVEEVVPREEWPHEIHSTAKDSDPQLRAIVDAAIAELNEGLGEDTEYDLTEKEGPA